MSDPERGVLQPLLDALARYDQSETPKEANDRRYAVTVAARDLVDVLVGGRP